MRKLCLLLLLFFFGATEKSYASINVFACEPEWASLAKEIGGEKVDVFSATRGTQDPHHISAKPSLLSAIRKADLMVCTGGGLEAGWLPVLMRSASGSVQQGQPGHLLAGDNITFIEKPASVDRSMGDIHPEGNPHIQADPKNILLMSKLLAQRLSNIDAPNASYFRSRQASFETNWNAAISRWSQSGADLKGVPVVTYHNSWAYLLNWLGMKQVATLEIKPGIPPTPSHLAQVLDATKKSGAKIIILSPFDNEDAAQWLAGQSGATIVRLPFTVGGLKDVDTLNALFEKTITLLKAAK